MKNVETEEDKAKMKDRWLQIDAEQNEEWLRKQGTCPDKSSLKSVTDIKKC